MAVHTESLKHSLKQLDAFRKEGNHDLIIYIGEKQFPCHRHLVAAASPTLKPLLLKENWASEKTTLKSIDPEVFGIILDFIYTGMIHIPADNALKLLKVADYLAMDHLMESCITQLGSLCPVLDLIEAYRYAKHLNNSELKINLERQMARNLGALHADEQFLSFPLATIKRILQENQMFIFNTYCSCYVPKKSTTRNSWCTTCRRSTNEEPHKRYVLPTIMSWVERKILSRIDYFHNLYNIYARYNNSDTACNESWKKLFERHRIELRKCVDVINEKINVHIVKDDEIMTFTKFSKSEGWFLKTNFPSNATYLRTVAKNREIFYLSHNAADDQNQFWKGNKIMNMLSSPPLISCDYKLAAAKDIVYLYDFSRISSSPHVAKRSKVEVPNMYTYIEGRDKWFSEPCSPKQLYHSYFVSLDNTLYLIGGSPEYETSCSNEGDVQQYDPRTSSWDVTASDVVLPLNGGVCALDNMIYIISKVVTTDDVEGKKSNLMLYSFDTRVKKWNIEDQNLNVVNEFEPSILVPFEGNLWTFSRNPQSVMVYDVKTKMWKDPNTLPSEIGKSDEYQILDAVVS